MANELNIAIQTTGLATVVARIYTPGFTQVGADVTMAEVGGPSGLYTGSVSAATLATDIYHIVFFDTAGAPDTPLGRGILGWDVDGDKEIEPGAVALDVWKDRGLDPDDDKVITEVTAGTNYTEAATGILKTVTKSGSTTTIDRA
jgi:hypothetical protein